METYDKDWLERASAGATDNVLSTGMATRLSDGIKGLEAQLGVTRAEWVKTCQSSAANHDKLWAKHEELKKTLESIRFICKDIKPMFGSVNAIAKHILAILGEE